MNTGKKIPKLNTNPIAANHEIVAEKHTSQDHLPSCGKAIFSFENKHGICALFVASMHYATFPQR